MTLILSGTDGLSDVDGSAATPAIRGTDANTGIFFPAADTIAFSEGGTEAMRIDSSGNVGIGTASPTNLGANFKTLELQAGSSSAGGGYYLTGNGTVTAQLGVDTLTSYIGTRTAHPVVFTTTNTERMRIDSSGNVGIGTASPTTKLHVSGTGDTRLQVESTSSGAGVIYLNGSTAGFAGYNTIQSRNSSTVQWAIGGSGDQNTLPFYTNGTEAMRIDSNGCLLVGTTTGIGTTKFVLGGNSTTSRVLPRTDNVGYVGESTYRWQAIYAVNGTIQTSDGREKNTITDSNLGLDFINALRPVSYKWNVGENLVTYDSEGKEVVTPRPGVRLHYGFIAQEVKAAIPEGVDFGGFVQEPDDGMMSLRYHEFIGPLVKAIQEQQALITTLTDRITALEAPTGTQA